MTGIDPNAGTRSEGLLGTWAKRDRRQRVSRKELSLVDRLPPPPPADCQITAVGPGSIGCLPGRADGRARWDPQSRVSRKKSGLAHRLPPPLPAECRTSADRPWSNGCLPGLPNGKPRWDG